MFDGEAEQAAHDGETEALEGQPGHVGRPIVQPPFSEDQRQVTSEVVKGYNFVDMHVLIAEDDRVTGEILARTLQRWNYSTTVVGDGAQAWDRLRVATDPTLAILDWMMPEMDGPDVCRRVRQDLPLANMYLLLVTARESRGDVVAGLDAGADDYIIKPFDPEELRARVAVGARVLGLQQKLAERVEELQTALSNVKQLRGLLPICSYCKRIRGDDQYLAAGRGLRRGALRRAVQPRHLPAVLREGVGRDRRDVAQPPAALTAQPFYATTDPPRREFRPRFQRRRPPTRRTCRCGTRCTVRAS